MTLPARVRIVEVGPRDGLQNETVMLSVETKVELIELLVQAGLTSIEIGSFVSEKAAPQMASTDEVVRRLRARSDLQFSALVPNMRGLSAALGAGVQEIAVFTSASETFSQKNINCSISESLTRFSAMIKEANQAGIRVRGYVSCAMGCPYEGAISLSHVTWVAQELHAMGCEEVSLGDTIGVGTPLAARRMVEAVAKDVGMERVAVHFHDTYGQALANIFACLEAGIAVVDSSIAGLGGCPFAPGASGNVATEDVIYMLDGLEIETGVNLSSLMTAGDFILGQLDRAPASSVAKALNRKRGR